MGLYVFLNSCPVTRFLALLCTGGVTPAGVTNLHLCPRSRMRSDSPIRASSLFVPCAGTPLIFFPSKTIHFSHSRAFYFSRTLHGLASKYVSSGRCSELSWFVSNRKIFVMSETMVETCDRQSCEFWFWLSGRHLLLDTFQGYIFAQQSRQCKLHAAWKVISYSIIVYRYPSRICWGVSVSYCIVLKVVCWSLNAKDRIKPFTGLVRKI